MILKLSSFFVLLLQCTALPHLYRVIDCDDPQTHEAALFALQHINLNHNHGYKYALSRVEDAKAYTKNQDHVIYILELDLLETKCPSVSPTPVDQCIVRPRNEQAVEGDCDVKIQKLHGNYTVLGVRCKSELDSAENVFPVCPLCHLAPLNDTNVIHAVDVSLVNFNAGNNTVFYHLHEIGRGQFQAANSVRVEFVVAASNCSIEEANSGLSACVAKTGADAQYGGCVSTVVPNPALQEETVNVQCNIYGPQPAQDQQATVQDVPVVPQQPKVHGHYHHNLYHSSLWPHSSESSSAEHHHKAIGKPVVRRSLTGEPVPPNTLQRPLCPGRKIFF
ncbi:alpha-2-HS-glycoprotein [Pelobates fuscus]|uniref:alpha-2-HS-glycoprotein n=1 Tax=Pelobates fuscus TaxID=191477 RepID=UPI002FE4C092